MATEEQKATSEQFLKEIEIIAEGILSRYKGTSDYPGYYHESQAIHVAQEIVKAAMSSLPKADKAQSSEPVPSSSQSQQMSEGVQQAPISGSLPCECCGQSGKKVTLHFYGHRNGIYVGAYTERGIRCEAHKDRGVCPRQ